jgi:SH3 domain protein
MTVKTTQMRFVLTAVCLFILSTAPKTPVSASERVGFLNDSIKIMMRTGRGTDYRIIAMPSLGQKVTVLEDAGDWVKIRTDAGTEGWVLSRFVGYDIPYRIRFDELQKEYTLVSEKLSVLEQENKRLTQENREMDKRLKTEIGQMTAEVEKLSKENRILRDEMANRLIKWFLAGAGVLFFGFLIGYLTKRGRRRSYLL